MRSSSQNIKHGADELLHGHGSFRAPQDVDEPGHGVPPQLSALGCDGLEYLPTILPLAGSRHIRIRIGQSTLPPGDTFKKRRK
jgi:hypothetical protein